MTDTINNLQTSYENLLAFLQTKGISVNSEKDRTLDFPLRVDNLKQLKMACIMDPFTRLSYAPECILQDITPENWKSEIDVFAPDMLFIESAWQGKDALWHRKIANGSKELFALTSYCKAKKIPVIYWGKEDPVYTQTFMPAAAQADVIFTCDFDSIPAYKAGTGNSHVYHLHFAAQPKIHNPIETMERKDKFCFAGAYYHRYQERCQVFDNFADYFIATKGFDIYDRNHGNALPEHAFPKRYNSHILGKLAPEEIDVAYKGYNYGINLNSITQSHTMFARRVFELMASNTLVIGNYSLGVKQYFGDLTIATNNVETVKNTINTIDIQKLRLLALRKVLSEHLYEDRLAYIVEKVFGKDVKSPQPKIAVVVKQDALNAQNAFNRQNYENKFLHIYTTTDDVKSLDADYVAYFADDDYYGPNYLTDLALATRFLPADINGVVKGIDKGCYQAVASAGVSCSIIKTTVFDGFENIVQGNFFAIDSFNYAQGFDGESCPSVDDILNIDSGMPLQAIQEAAEKISMSSTGNILLSLTSRSAAPLFKEGAKSRGIVADVDGNVLHIKYDTANNTEYVYFSDTFTLSNLCMGGKLTVSFNAVADDTAGLVIVFYDDNKQNLGNKMLAGGQTAIFMPFNDFPKATSVRIAFRLKGAGECAFSSLDFKGASSTVADVPSLVKSDTLVLTNIYPSYENLYRNMFVHSRVRAYKERGFVCDVISTNIYAKNVYREFEGINVIEGHIQRLADVMATGKIKTVCAHFLDEQMFAVLKCYLDDIRLIVWVHGAEIQPWWRREYNYDDPADLAQAKQASEKRVAFWQEVFAVAETKNIHFVFVSQYFANEVMEDYKVELPKNKYSIIHNMIDTEMFDYVEKDAEQRKRIFSCRPFASRTYANDLTVNAILALSKEKAFEDMFFHIAGVGELFKELTKPLRKFKNVCLEERYYSHTELAALHKEFGVCLIPSRMDTHGVSRDEAMSSGLVPVTTAVAAIPEFVNDECGILVEAEDWQGLADGILRLYNAPELFDKLSRNAAERVRAQSATSKMMKAEMSLVQELVEFV